MKIKNIVLIAGLFRASIMLNMINLSYMCGNSRYDSPLPERFFLTGKHQGQTNNLIPAQIEETKRRLRLKLTYRL